MKIYKNEVVPENAVPWSSWLFEPKKAWRWPMSARCYQWFSGKYDGTTWTHFFIGMAFGFQPWLGPEAGICWNVAHNMANGYGSEACVGRNRCKQGFNIIDFGAQLVGQAIGYILQWAPAL